MNSIPFNKPFLSGNESEAFELLLKKNKFSGDGEFTEQCNKKITRLTGALKSLLTTSCTHALEMTALLIGIQPGDEVIMSSYTFVSSANPFILRGAKIIFVDIRPETMNIDERLIEAAISPKTKAIILMHYGGVACNMPAIAEIAQKHRLKVIEDAAQCIDAYYKDKHLGTFGDFGTLSFHDTKNIHCGEGGSLLINDQHYKDRADIIREKGTDRSKFIAGLIDKYSWVDVGSSYLPSEFNAAILNTQLDQIKQVTSKRLLLWNRYLTNLKPLSDEGIINMSAIPDADHKHNGHLFFIKCAGLDERNALMAWLKKNGVTATFHYIPLHSSLAGKKMGAFFGNDVFTSRESERLLRLPLYYELYLEQVDFITELIFSFYKK